MSRGRAVQNTWAKRCHIPVFFYSRAAAAPNSSITQASGTVALDVPDGRDHLTGKTMAALMYSYEKYGHIADWFLKADDDTYERFSYLSITDGVSVTILGYIMTQCRPHRIPKTSH